jgi:hypothetical protein
LHYYKEVTILYVSELQSKCRKTPQGPERKGSRPDQRLEKTVERTTDPRRGTRHRTERKLGTSKEAHDKKKKDFLDLKPTGRESTPEKKKKVET